MANAPTRAEIDALYRYEDFPGFLLAFKNITEHLRTPDDYELITYRLMQRLKEENVLHAEVYVSVGVCLWRKQDFAAIFEGLDRGRARGARDFGVSLLWIFDAVRQFGAEAAQKVFELAVRYHDRDVVGIGIGGDEQKAPPELFRDAYAWSADHGLRLTAHAGETGPPESIWGALNLRVERIGHGLTAFHDPDLVEELAQRQVPVEICLTSNFRTGLCPNLADHPAKNYFRPRRDDHAQQRRSGHVRHDAGARIPDSRSRSSDSPTSTCANWHAIRLKRHSCPRKRSWSF